MNAPHAPVAPDWTREARALMRRGYLVVPIKPGHKRPAIAEWQAARLGAGDLPMFARNGVGIQTGQGAVPVYAGDVDCSSPRVVERFTAFCAERYGLMLERVGRAPRTMLVFRMAEAGLAKRASSWFVDEDGGTHRLEVLGKGQQFVAYHIHPDTGEPYEWTDMLGGLVEVDAVDLVVLTPEQVGEMIEAFERFAIEDGLARRAGSGATRAGLVTAPEGDAGSGAGSGVGRVRRPCVRDFRGAQMTTLLEAAKAALDALEQLQGGCTDSDDGTVEAITVWCPDVTDALRAAIAEAEQAEPVAWRPALKSVDPIYRSGNWIDDQPSVEDIDYWTRNGQGIEYAYSSPPAERRPMTEGEARAMWHAWAKDRDTGPTELIRAVERHHGITGGSDDGGGA